LNQVRLSNCIVRRQGILIVFLNVGSINGCVCPDDTLTYECTVAAGSSTGGTSTVWTGNAFICPPQNEIVLVHSRFESANGISHSCNNGAIVGRILSVEDNNYTSQLNVTVIPNTAGKTITCIGDNGSTTMLIFSQLTPSTG
jgi:hypothetical protein